MRYELLHELIINKCAYICMKTPLKCVKFSCGGVWSDVGRVLFSPSDPTVRHSGRTPAEVT
jgi:hypothetical protein